jgi:hypothetical protein
MLAFIELVEDLGQKKDTTTAATLVEIYALAEHSEKASAEKPTINLIFEGKATKWKLQDAEEVLQALFDAKVSQDSKLMGV